MWGLDGLKRLRGRKGGGTCEEQGSGDLKRPTLLQGSAPCVGVRRMMFRSLRAWDWVLEAVQDGEDRNGRLHAMDCHRDVLRQQSCHVRPVADHLQHHPNVVHGLVRPEGHRALLLGHVRHVHLLQAQLSRPAVHLANGLVLEPALPESVS